jgi:hypothetical protein
MGEEITIEIDTAGDAKVSIKGVKGKSCRDITRDIERALGQVTTDTVTHEYREVENRADQNRTQR